MFGPRCYLLGVPLSVTRSTDCAHIKAAQRRATACRSTRAHGTRARQKAETSEESTQALHVLTANCERSGETAWPTLFLPLKQGRGICHPSLSLIGRSGPDHASTIMATKPNHLFVSYICQVATYIRLLASQ